LESSFSARKKCASNKVWKVFARLKLLNPSLLSAVSVHFHLILIVTYSASYLLIDCTDFKSISIQEG